MNKSTGLVAMAIAIALLQACSKQSDDKAADSPAQSAASTTDAEKSNQVVPKGGYPQEAFFGDTHVHTGWSVDAGMDGAVKTPEEAYKLAQGGEVISNTGLKVRLKRPYDWFMVTDHSDAMGVINQVVDGHPEMMADATVKRWSEALNSGDEAAAAGAKSELIVMQSEERLPAVVMDPKWMKTAWELTIDAAEQFYRPGEFTTFIAYEWTVNSDGGNNLHRNVIFRDGAAQTRNLLPLTTFTTQDPKDLWQWMADYENNSGGQVLAIPHNGNMSNGRMFEEQQFDGSAMSKEWAAMRANYEPLYELTQIKGQSESHPSLSPDDQFAAWDLWDRGNLAVKPKPEGALQYEYWREALKSGMRIKQELGVNPFQLGANAGSDTHTGLATTEEDNFFGKFKTLEPSNKTRWSFPIIDGPSDSYIGWEQASSGVMGVWATENTREAIWDAMKRKETFATTGTRMKVRLFAGFNFAESDMGSEGVASGYANGVPMGGSISEAPEGKNLMFIVSALKDPEGANLDRAQLVKGWVDAEGKVHEKIFNVAWSGDRSLDEAGGLAPVGNTVNMDTAQYDNSIGKAQLNIVFTDPEFDPELNAFYYLRVLEIPTPRWTLYDKVKHGLKDMDSNVPLTHQERAFSSPIWYTP